MRCARPTLGFRPEDKFEVEVAPSLGMETLFISKMVIICFQVSTWLTNLVSPSTQYNLSTMGRLSSEQCILISDIKADSVPFEMK